MRRRLSFVLSLALVSGCSPEPETSRLREGTEATVHHRRYTTVEVATEEGGGLNGGEVGYLDVGSTVYIQEDAGDASDSSRIVTAIGRRGTGDLRGKMLKIPRRLLRP